MEQYKNGHLFSRSFLRLLNVTKDNYQLWIKKIFNFSTLKFQETLSIVHCQLWIIIGLLPRTFPVATPFLPRSYPVSSGLLPRTLNVPWTNPERTSRLVKCYLPPYFPLTIPLLSFYLKRFFNFQLSRFHCQLWINFFSYCSTNKKAIQYLCIFAVYIKNTKFVAFFVK